MKNLKKNTAVDKTYYIFGDVDKQAEEFRKQLNSVIYLQKRKRNIKKYELLNVLVLIGLKHKKECLHELGVPEDELGELDF